MKNIPLFLFLFFGFVNIYSSCGKYKDENVEVVFELPLSITPIKDTINIGDTLTLEANFPDSIKEVKSGRYYKLENFDFQTRIGFKKLGDTTRSVSQQPGNAGTYTMVNSVGAITGLQETFGGIDFLYEASRYKLKVRLVPKQKGVFCISFFSRHFGNNTELFFLNLGPSIGGGRKKAYLRNIWYVINNGQTNFELYRKNTKVGDLNSPHNSNYEQKATYSFVVK